MIVGSALEEMRSRYGKLADILHEVRRKKEMSTRSDDLVKASIGREGNPVWGPDGGHVFVLPSVRVKRKAGSGRLCAHSSAGRVSKVEILIKSQFKSRFRRGRMISL
jgi:hypothetical protein